MSSKQLSTLNTQKGKSGEQVIAAGSSVLPDSANLATANTDQEKFTIYHVSLRKALSLRHCRPTGSVVFPEPYNRVRLCALIGKGRFGVVYSALSHGRVFAIKTTEDAVVYRFELQAFNRIASASEKLTLDNSFGNVGYSASKWHPCLARLFNSTAHNDRGAPPIDGLDSTTQHQGVTKYHLLLEYFPAGDLEDLAFTDVYRKMHATEAIFYFLEISEGLIFLHENGIIHHDIQACNVLIRENGHCAITDFGTSYTMSTGPVVPTISMVSSDSPHMPPEVRCPPPKTCHIWHAVDWFSAGVILYRLLNSGVYPIFPEPHVIDLDQLDKLHIYMSENTTCVKTLVKRLLWPNPKLRLGGNLQHPGSGVLSDPECISALLNDKPDELFSLRFANNNVGQIRSNLPSNLLDLLHLSLNEPSACAPPVHHQWLNDLRKAIRQQRLIPPFVPY